MGYFKSSDNTITSVIDREIVVNRLFDAPRELVFKTWTDSEHLTNWWGPKGFTITVQEFDIRPGGVWSYIMHGPDGTDYLNKITYREVVSPEKLVYSHGDGDEDESFRVTVTFAERGKQTELTMRMQFKTVEELEQVVKEYGALEGAKSTFDRLAERLKIVTGG